MKKTYLLFGVFSFAILTGCIKEVKEENAANQSLQSFRSLDEVFMGAVNENANTAAGDHVPNQVLVKFKPGTSEESKSQAFTRISAKVTERILTNAMKHFGDNDGIYLLHTPLQALEAISRISGVEIEYAEPNYIYRHGATSTDSRYTDGSLWGMYGDATSPANQYGSQAGEAWAAGHTGSAAVYVGVIDEGIQFEHPDLNEQVWTNTDDPIGGGDNDGNGYVDDIHGWDFANSDNTVYDGGTTGNLDDHGTHVAGTIGAKSDNNGVVGVNWNVTLISGKFLGSGGGSLANAIKAVDYFTDLKIRKGLNIVATNNSWGGGSFSQALLDAITRGAKKDILFIAAAGNGNIIGIGQNNDKRANYPSNYNTQGQTGGAVSSLNDGTKCNYDAVIAVAAINSTGGLAGFSNYGRTTVDLGAPGVGVWSTTAYNGYSSYNGTSMATPHVTGGAALRAAYTTERGAALKETILNAAKATLTSSLSGKTATGGRLNVSGF